MDTAINPIVQQSREQLRDKHRSAVAEAKAVYEAKLERLWLAAERKRKADWISKERFDNPMRSLPYPYATLNDAECVRVATPAEDRIRVLGETYAATKDMDCLVEAAKVWLYRRGSKAPLAEVKDFLKRWIPVDGDAELFTEHRTQHTVLNGPVGRGQRVPNIERHVIARGLSPVLASVIRSFHVKNGVVYFAGNIEIVDRPGIRDEKLRLAHQMVDEYPADEY